MNHDSRRAVVNAVIGLAGSPDFRDRADAARTLASFIEIPHARESLLALVLDNDDTHVARVAAEALLRRQDMPGLAIVASALSGADFNHVFWIHTAVLDVFGILASDRDAAVRICEELLREPGETPRRGTAQLREMLTEIDPVLHPASDSDQA
jgi:hypothetical protein